MTLVSVAVIAYFAKNPTLEPNQPLKTKVMPALATVGFSLVAYFGISGFDILTGTPGPLAVALPSLILIAGIIGAIRAATRPAAMPRLNADAA